jgi:hypothetical protein
MGDPWWDYLVPLFAMARGFPLKKVGVDEPLGLHYVHEPRYSKERWLRNGEEFLACVERLRDGSSFADGLLAELAGSDSNLEHRLHRISAIMCGAMP